MSFTPLNLLSLHKVGKHLEKELGNSRLVAVILNLQFHRMIQKEHNFPSGLEDFL